MDFNKLSDSVSSWYEFELITFWHKSPKRCPCFAALFTIYATAISQKWVEYHLIFVIDDLIYIKKVFWWAQNIVCCPS